MWNQENVGHVEPFTVTPVALAPATALTEATIIRTVAPNPPLLTRTRITDTVTSGGRGWFGTVQGGCDYQFGLGPYQLVIGAFGDYDFADIHGRHAFAGLPLVADEKLSSQWAVGGRIGWVALPNLMVFFSGGYTEARFDRQNYTNLFGPPFGIDQGAFTDERTYKGWFLGAGDEYALNFLPGLFWKPNIGSPSSAERKAMCCSGPRPDCPPSSRKIPRSGSRPCAASWSIGSTGVVSAGRRGTDQS